LFGDRTPIRRARLAGVTHRILLGVDGRADRAMMKTAGEATARFRSLAAAVRVRGGRAMNPTSAASIRADGDGPLVSHGTSFLADD